MDGKIITTINHFKAWGNAKEILEKIEMAGKMDLLDQYISELYPDGISGSDFNDLIGIDHDEVLQAIGIYNDIYDGEDDVMPENESLLSKLDKTFSEALEESLNEYYYTCQDYEMDLKDNSEKLRKEAGKLPYTEETDELDAIASNVKKIAKQIEKDSDKFLAAALEESLNEGKQFYLGWRSNPQLKDGGYFKRLGQLSKKEAKGWEKCAYGSMSLTAYDSEDEYNQAIEKAKEEGKSVR